MLSFARGTKTTEVQVELDKLECKSLQEVFQFIAEQANLEVTESTKFDCREILVSSEIESIVFDYYKYLGYSYSTIIDIWLCYGPKTDKTLERDKVLISEYFLTST